MGLGLRLDQNPLPGREGAASGWEGCRLGEQAAELTNDKDRHEGPTGHWDGGGQCGHPEL